jgi:hypothetical protein|tara:strand:+ start:205 stop:513 length:309 start_codon:yes stop_codon:yes gene_type:complete
MRMNLTKEGVLHLGLFEVETQEEQDQFIYYYLGLSRDVKKKFENAYYQAYHKKLLSDSEAKIIHTDVNNVTHIEVHPADILKNLNIIKQILLGHLIVEDENE